MQGHSSSVIVPAHDNDVDNNIRDALSVSSLRQTGPAHNVVVVVTVVVLAGAAQVVPSNEALWTVQPRGFKPCRDAADEGRGLIVFCFTNFVKKRIEFLGGPVF